jgi:death-on-curing protein
VSDVVALHHEVMLRTRDKPRPLTDEGKLESAVMRPQFARQYSGADLIRQATVLGIGVSQAHALEEGSKRTAFMALRTFLRLNGLRFVGNPVELAKQLVAVAERKGSMDEATNEFEKWLRGNVAAAPALRRM